MTTTFEGEIPQGIAADPSGANPKQFPGWGSPGLEPYKKVRTEFDIALQATGERAYFPQADVRDVGDYRRQLLTQLTRHTANYQRVDARFIGDADLPRMQKQIIADALTEPHRQGRLAEVKVIDRTGREVSEFIGPKSAWMAPLKGRVQATGVRVDGKRRLTPMGF